MQITMPYDKITYRFLDCTYELSPHEARCSIACQNTMFGAYHQISVAISTSKVKTAVYSGRITIDLLINHLASGPLTFNRAKKNALILTFPTDRGQTTYYDGNHEDLSGSIRLFLNAGRPWLHLECADGLVANIAFEFDGYEIPESQVDWFTSALKTSGFKAVKTTSGSPNFSDWKTKRIVLGD